jgi:23S rRNA (cytidine1920-2'-O)/16S rRNA (cytidine1409-2'-O)-methyltransferase
MPIRQRIDRLLVERGLFESRAKAQAAIAAGLVSAGDRLVHKASDEFPIDVALSAAHAHPYVSRGGVKLADALDKFAIAVDGRIALDVGASTGGFTEVLLARGARKVYAVDVGRDQLHARLRANPAVISLEETDIRRLDPARLPEAPDIIVVDVSFISLKHVVEAITALAAPRADLVALIKPQFEAPRRAIKKGIVRDPAVHAAVCDDVAAFIGARGWRVVGIVPCAITGSSGNQEFFLGASRD